MDGSDSGGHIVGSVHESDVSGPRGRAIADARRMPIMQQPATRQLGATGEAAVDLFFKDLGWGPLSTGDQDLGTDLLVQIRDEDLRDLTLMIGVQVKTGDSWFSVPGEFNGRGGWWYSEADQKHANFWTNHPVPHIIVLQNQDRSTRIWNFVNRETIRITGRGFKVFVPSDQVLDASQSGKWLDAAVKGLKHLSFEGSHWDFAIANVAEGERARYALLAPRLVEPHPNKGFAIPISWPEAIALCIQGDADRWEFFAQRHGTVPSISEGHSSTEWGWRFAAAIHSWIYDAKVAPLETLSIPEDISQYRVAHSITLALALVDQGRASDAEVVLARVAIEDEYSAEQGWISLQRARIQIEAGKLDAGRSLIEQANVQLAPVPRDVTVSALRAAAAWNLFEITDFGVQDVATALPAMDTVPSWWRTQTVAAALESAVTRGFQSWAEDTSISLGADTPHNLLFSAALVARLSGSHGQWRSSTALLAMVDLSTKRLQEEDLNHPLNALRQAGDDKNLALAIQKVRRTGPARALQELIGEVSPEAMTRTSSQADLVTVRYAGSFASAEHAERLLDFMLESLERPEDFSARFAPRYHVFMALAEALTGILPFADDMQYRRLIEVILKLPDIPNQILELTMQRMSAGISRTAIDDCQELILERASSSELVPWFRWRLLAMIGPSNAVVRGEIRSGLLAGSLDPLDALRKIDLLEDDEARRVLDVCRVALAQCRQEAHNGGYSSGSMDWARLLAQVNVYVPGVAEWEGLIDFLADTNISADRKRATCKFLAAVVSKLEVKIQAALQGSLEVLRTIPNGSVDRFSGREPIGGAFDELLLSITGEEDPAHDEILTNMLTGDDLVRYDAIDYLSSMPGHEQLLALMTSDRSIRVSRRAMLCLAHLLTCSDNPDTLYVDVLMRLLDQDGESNALHIAGGLASGSELPPQLHRVLKRLVDHPSADVRAKVAAIRDP